jgi:hypothetical protein
MIIGTILLGAGAVVAGQLGPYLEKAGAELAQNLVPEFVSGATERTIDLIVGRVTPERNHDFMRAIAAAMRKATQDLLALEINGREVFFTDSDRAIWQNLGKDSEKIFVEEFGEPQKAVRNALLIGTVDEVSKSLEVFVDSYFQHCKARTPQELKLLLTPAFLHAFEYVLKQDNHEKGWKAFQRDLAWAIHQQILELGKGQAGILVRLKAMHDGQIELPDIADEFGKQAKIIIDAIEKDGRLTRKQVSILYKYVQEQFDTLKKFLEPSATQPAEIDLRYQDSFFIWDGNFASSFRLLGASSEFFPPSTLHINPNKDAQYKLPANLLLQRGEIISRLTEDARQRGAMLYDGPNTRLINYHVTPIDSTEQKHLYLDLGPIGWHDYSVCRFALDHTVKQRTFNEIQEYIDLDEIANTQIIRNNKLTNILCTATTLITSDGFILYSQRGQRVGPIPSRLTSAVAENIHQEFDQSLEEAPSGQLPAPFRTVLRGIEEEASPRIASLIRSRPSLMFLLSLDFELLSFQPDLLFLVFLPLEYEQFKEICRQYKGRDFIEGQIQGFPISDNDRLQELLSNPNWIPSGKASLIRALEFVSAVEAEYPDLQLREIIEKLEEKNI